jgi:hypothetical protein
MRVIGLAIVGLLIAISVSVLLQSTPRDATIAQPTGKAPTDTPPSDAVMALLDERREMDEGVWAQEVAAQKHEETIVKYWDRMLRPEDDKFAVLAEFPFDSITLDAPAETAELDWSIKRTTFEGEWKTLDRDGWRGFLTDMKNREYAIDAIEFHQSAFDVDGEGNAVSVFRVLLNVVNDDRRIEVKTNLRVAWTGEQDSDGLHIPGALGLSDTTVLERKGPEAFEHRTVQNWLDSSSYPIAYDLNRDGFSDILLPSNNIVLINRADGSFDKRDLFTADKIPPPRNTWTTMTAAVADFDSDGHPDILYVGRYRRKVGIYLFRGTESGEFPTPGKEVTPPNLVLKGRGPMCIATGDIDADGDLDAWVAQYKNPYIAGQMPTPFYDANDGYPSYLLLNRGDGQFDDATEAAGLAPKRHRRTFAASFVDLDEDRDLDLLVSSDFAGTDIYYNDGAGRFTDETTAVLDDASNFGMAHTLADFDQDGALDFYVIGMASTTMRRLNHMGLIRSDHPEFLEMRTRMGYGNRMYLSRGARAFRQPDFKDSLARSGWAWGTTSFDFDSDGDMDVYVANGHKSGKTTKDYCTRFWCHDIYIDNSKPSQVMAELFKETRLTPEAMDYSWDGYQKNHLFMNQSGEDFVNVGFLMNAALGDDARSVISDDFNNDGRPDLLVTSRHMIPGREQFSHTLHLFVNQWRDPNNWIGVRLQEAPGRPSPVGAKIAVKYPSGTQVAQIVTGDSYRSQHAPMKHFGLGKVDKVASISVTWPDGTACQIDQPAINTYHLVKP